MSRIIVQSLEGSIQHAFGLVNEFLKVCPETVWAKKFGGWPVWQQVYHTFAVIDFFLPEQDAAPEAPLFASDVVKLKVTPPETPEKNVIQTLVAKAQTRAGAYAASLDDDALVQKNEGLSARFGREVTHAGTLALIGGHTMYHLGSCDAALREQGLPGVF